MCRQISDLVWSHNDKQKCCVSARSNIRALIIANHYLHRGSSPSHVFSAVVNGTVEAAVWFGVGASGHARKGVCPTDPTLAFELTRLWIADESAVSASGFLSIAIRDMPKCIVFSYADTDVGHQGGVYLACSFNYAGWTGMAHTNPLRDRPTTGNQHSRAGDKVPFSEWTIRSTKIKYWRLGGPMSKTDRKAFNKLCGWPCYDHRLLPRPLGHLKADKALLLAATIKPK